MKNICRNCVFYSNGVVTYDTPTCESLDGLRNARPTDFCSRFKSKNRHGRRISVAFRKQCQNSRGDFRIELRHILLKGLLNRKNRYLMSIESESRKSALELMLLSKKASLVESQISYKIAISDKNTTDAIYSFNRILLWKECISQIETRINQKA